MGWLVSRARGVGRLVGAPVARPPARCEPARKPLHTRARARVCALVSHQGLPFPQHRHCPSPSQPAPTPHRTPTPTPPKPGSLVRHDPLCYVCDHAAGLLHGELYLVEVVHDLVQLLRLLVEGGRSLRGLGPPGGGGASGRRPGPGGARGRGAPRPLGHTWVHGCPWQRRGASLPPPATLPGRRSPSLQAGRAGLPPICDCTPTSGLATLLAPGSLRSGLAPSSPPAAQSAGCPPPPSPPGSASAPSPACPCAPHA